MIRDFSNSAKKKLLEYVKDATETTLWRKIGDRIGDAGLQIQYWFGALSISKYIDNLDAYHKKIIDKNNTTSQRIEEIFTNVKNIDTRYQGGLQQNVNFSESVINFINDLANTIDPNGGNMDMQKMNAALAASLEKIQEAKLSREKAIEDSLLGTDPDAVETSIDPVNLSTGNFIYDFEDLAIDGEIPLSFHRYYNSKDSRISVLGKSFRHNYEIYLNVNDDGEVDIIMEDGQHKVFAVENGVYYGKNTATDFLTSDKQHFYLKDVDDNTYIFDKDKKLIRIENRNNLGISLTYDEDKLLIKVVNDYGDCLNYEYDEKTNLLARVFDHTGRDVVITYSDEKRIKTVCSALGKNISYEYASNGRIKDIVNSQKIHTVENIYDKKFRVIRQLFSDGGSMSFEYDDENHTVTQTERNGVQTIFVHDGQYRNTEINVSGQRTSITYPNGETVKYSYDEFKRLTSLEEANNITTYEYDQYSHLQLKTMPNGVSTEYSYDNRGLLASLTNKDANGILDRYFYKYDCEGNKTEIIKSRRNMPQENGHYTYCYDALRKLTSVHKDGNLLHAYEYDAHGNRIRMTTKDGVTNYQYNKLNQLISKIDSNGNEKYIYDSRGNLSQIDCNGQTKHTFVYGVANRLTEARNADGAYAKYEYSGLGHRIGVTQQMGPNDPEVQIRYVLDITKQYNNILQKEEAGETQTYLFDSKVSGMIHDNGIRSYFLHDDLGSPIRLLKPEGDVLESYAYDEFGCDVGYTPSQFHSFGYTGYQKDSVTGIYYAQAREYMPVIARFAARDFVKGQQDDPLSMNEYIYCRDNPTEYADANGLFVLSTLAIIGVGAAVGALTSAGVNAVSQGIKIAKGEQEEFQWGSLAGSAVEGAVVGGVAAIPGLGTVAAAALTVTAGGVGAAANSAISQGIDEGKVDGKKVAEDAVIGAVVSGAFYGIGKGVKALKGKFSKTKMPTTKSTKDLYEDTIKGLKKNETKMDAIEAAGKKASSLTRKTQQRLLSERNSLLKKYGLEKLKSGFFSSKSGFSGVVDSVKKYAFMIFGIKTTKSIVKDLLKGMCPIYTSEDEQTLVEYMEDYFGTLYGKVTGKCPLYS